MIRVFLPLAALAQVLPAPAVAQRGARNVRRVETLDEPQQLPLPASGRVTRPELLDAAARPTILVTGYWPPTNEAVRRFSTNPARKPQGWIGADWEGRGYDVVSYFPEFNPPDCDQTCGRGTGAIEVDYQDTVRDWDRIVAEIRPIAIVTLSRGFNGFSWELE